MHERQFTSIDRDHSANYHTVGAGLKPALFPPRDDEPVMRLMASSC